MDNNKAKDKQTEDELSQINKLLRDSLFAVKVASRQEPDNAEASHSFKGASSQAISIDKPFREEKIATNLAGFYAVECGIGAISKLTGKKPIDILKLIVDKQLDSAYILLLNRFANATWKASQPFRGFNRIQRGNFVVAAYLSKEEIKKDYDQIVAASTILLTKLHAVQLNSSATDQLVEIEKLLKNEAFAEEVAAYMQAAYYKGQNEPVPNFMQPEEDTAMLRKSKREENLAINLAGFYALTCGVEYLSLTQKRPPSLILEDILKDRRTDTDKDLLERFANATWKAGQPFRGLDRITREVFKPFDLLSTEEVEKDWKQIKGAAELLQEELLRVNPS